MVVPMLALKVSGGRGEVASPFTAEGGVTPRLPDLSVLTI